MDMFNFLQDYNFWGFSLQEILIFFVLILLTLLLAKFFSIVIMNYIKGYAEKTETKLDDKIVEAVEKPILWLIYIIGIYFSLLSLEPINSPIPLKSIMDGFVETSIAMVLTWFCFRLVDVFDEFVCNNIGSKKDTLLVHFFPLIKRSIKVAIAFIAFIIIVQNRGYSVTGLITGFGITGLAVGFAAKETIANIFGSFSLIFDQTYKVGDWIAVDKEVQGTNVEGIVEDISLRSTKIRAFDNTIIIIPNNEMAISTIKNVSKQKKRRIFEYIDITYDTPPEKIEQAVEICRNIVRNNPELDEYFQIHLNQLSAYSIKILFYVFTKTTDWGEYLTVRQQVLLNIIREFNRIGVEFAFPTQTLHLNESSVPKPSRIE